jgi:putative pyruvate formate lyase activating enzyme
MTLLLKNTPGEMYRQVGDLKVDKRGVAISGLIIRHLVLSQKLSGTDKILKWIAENISKTTYISLMAQYFPAFQASEYPDLARRINKDEYKRAEKIFNRSGLINGWIQQDN